MTPATATQLKPDATVRLLANMTDYYDGSADLDAGTVGKVVAVPDGDEGQTVLVDFGAAGHWQCWAADLEVAQ